MRGQIDLAILRPEQNITGLVFTKLQAEPLVVLMPVDHRLTVRDAVRPQDLAEEKLIGVPASRSPVLRAVTDAYSKRIDVDLTPDYEVDNLSMAMSLVGSTGGIALMPLYARNLLPPTVVTRPLDGVSPIIDLSIAYSEARSSSHLVNLVSRICRLRAGLALL